MVENERDLADLNNQRDEASIIGWQDFRAQVLVMVLTRKNLCGYVIVLPVLNLLVQAIPA